jgi:hypothetical protein
MGHAGSHGSQGDQSARLPNLLLQTPMGYRIAYGPFQIGWIDASLYQIIGGAYAHRLHINIVIVLPGQHYHGRLIAFFPYLTQQV